MRRQHFAWTSLTLAIVLAAYGGFTLIYHLKKGNDIPILSVVFLSIGAAMLLIFLILFLISALQKRNRVEEIKPIEEEKVETPEEEEEEEEPKPTPKPITTSTSKTTPRESDYEYRSEYRSTPRYTSRYDAETIYIRQTGYGSVIRVCGNQILDMRTNTYYRIQSNYVYQDGSGVVFEISGNRIRSAFGGYLFEISGGNINKTFGGFFASISGNTITVHDLSERYEMSGSLSLNQQLVVVALLFGKY